MPEDRTAKLRRRVYSSVDVAERDKGVAILLDGRPVKTPDKQDLAVPSRPLARAIADEWSAQGERIDPTTMPLTQIGCTALDRIGRHRGEITKTIAKFGETDLVCYRVEAPEDLAAKQGDAWQPILDWLASDFDVPLTVTHSILPAAQDERALTRLHQVIDRFDDHELASLSVLTQALGSIALGLAVMHARLQPDEAFAASQIDEEHQVERWGQDREAEQRRKSLANDVAAAARYLALHRAHN